MGLPFSRPRHSSLWNVALLLQVALSLKTPFSDALPFPRRYLFFADFLNDLVLSPSPPHPCVQESLGALGPCKTMICSSFGLNPPTEHSLPAAARANLRPTTEAYCETLKRGSPSPQDLSCRNLLFETHWFNAESSQRSLRETPARASNLELCPAYNGQARWRAIRSWTSPRLFGAYSS